MSLASMQTRSKAEVSLAKWRWPDTDGNPFCPRCRGSKIGFISTRGRYKCMGCYRQFSATSGTIFASHKMSKEALLAIINTASSAKSASALSDATGLTYRATWQRLQQHKSGNMRIPPCGKWERKNRMSAKAIEAGTAETGTGSVHESAVSEADLPEGGQP